MYLLNNYVVPEGNEMAYEIVGDNNIGGGGGMNWEEHKSFVSKKLSLGIFLVPVAQSSSHICGFTNSNLKARSNKFGLYKST